jgi:alpha,alpha-trehalase
VADRAARALPHFDSARRTIRARMADAASLFVALDYDGTLVPIAGSARPTDETVSVLGSLARSPGIRVAVLAGRGLEDLRGLLPVQELALAGLHGLEAWPPIRAHIGRIDIHRVRADLDRLLLAVQERLRGAPGPRIEDKRHAIAFHFGGFPKAAAARMRNAVQAAFRDVLEGSSLVLVPGREMLEARLAVVLKGNSARAIQEKIASGSLAIVIGDEQTDEDFFAAFVEDGIPIAVGSTKKTRARYMLRSQEEVIPRLREIEAMWRESRKASQAGG